MAQNLIKEWIVNPPSTKEEISAKYQFLENKSQKEATYQVNYQDCQDFKIFVLLSNINRAT